MPFIRILDEVNVGEYAEREEVYHIADFGKFVISTPKLANEPVMFKRHNIVFNIGQVIGDANENNERLAALYNESQLFFDTNKVIDKLKVLTELTKSPYTFAKWVGDELTIMGEDEKEFIDIHKQLVYVIGIDGTLINVYRHQRCYIVNDDGSTHKVVWRGFYH